MNFKNWLDRRARERPGCDGGTRSQWRTSGLSHLPCQREYSLANHW